jgi:hypothetical protein
MIPRSLESIDCSRIGVLVRRTVVLHAREQDLQALLQWVAQRLDALAGRH